MPVSSAPSWNVRSMYSPMACMMFEPWPRRWSLGSVATPRRSSRQPMIRRAQPEGNKRQPFDHDPALSLDDEVHAAERVLHIVVVGTLRPCLSMRHRTGQEAQPLLRRGGRHSLQRAWSPRVERDLSRRVHGFLNGQDRPRPPWSCGIRDLPCSQCKCSLVKRGWFIARWSSGRGLPQCPPSCRPPPFVDSTTGAPRPQRSGGSMVGQLWRGSLSQRPQCSCGATR